MRPPHPIRCSTSRPAACAWRYDALRATPPRMVLDHDRLLWYWCNGDDRIAVEWCPGCGGRLPDPIWLCLVAVQRHPPSLEDIRSRSPETWDGEDGG